MYTPAFVLPINDTPTKPNMNKGPELFVNAVSLCASTGVISPLKSKSEVILAPIGYPDVIPNIQANAPLPETLNNFSIGYDKIVPAKLTSPRLINMFVPIINGRRDGNALLNHKISPSFDASTISLGNNIIKKLKIAAIIGII